jgi:hypothetical protein
MQLRALPATVTALIRPGNHHQQQRPELHRAVTTTLSAMAWKVMPPAGMPPASMALQLKM